LGNEKMGPSTGSGTGGNEEVGPSIHLAKGETLEERSIVYHYTAKKKDQQ
jgi:hypothetical protein